MRDNPHLEGNRDDFIEKNMGLVKTICKTFTSRLAYYSMVDQDDVFSLGCMGLIKAYDGFDPTKFEEPPKFSTYAVPMIEGEVRRYLRDSSTTLKFSRSYREAYIIISTANMLSEEPEIIAKKLSMSMADVKRGLDFYKHQICISLDTPVETGENDNLTIADRVPSSPVNFTDNLVIEEFLKTVHPRTREIYALQANGYNQGETGEILGISQVQVSRIMTDMHKKAEAWGKGEGGRKSIKPKGVINTPPSKRKNHWSTNEQRALAKELLRTTDHTIAEIAQMTGVSQKTVKTYEGMMIKSKEASNMDNDIQVLPERRKGSWSSIEQQEEAKELLRTTDKTPSEIAHITGVTYATVNRYSKRIRNMPEKPVPRFSTSMPGIAPSSFSSTEPNVSAEPRAIEEVLTPKSPVTEDMMTEHTTATISACEGPIFISYDPHTSLRFNHGITAKTEQSTVPINSVFSLKGKGLTLKEFEAKVANIIMGLEVLGVKSIDFTISSDTKEE